MHIVHVVGARPNFMKAAPVLHPLGNRSGVEQTLVHTGQPYDANMSDVFSSQPEIPLPDVNLGGGAGRDAQQTAEVMSRFEPVLLERNPNVVLVHGDVNFYGGGCIAECEVRLPGIKGHVEAGLRSFDWTMPEAINRVVTDRLADLRFTPSEDGDTNLVREGGPAKKYLGSAYG